MPYDINVALKYASTWQGYDIKLVGSFHDVGKMPTKVVEPTLYGIGARIVDLIEVLETKVDDPQYALYASDIVERPDGTLECDICVKVIPNTGTVRSQFIKRTV